MRSSGVLVTSLAVAVTAFLFGRMTASFGFEFRERSETAAHPSADSEDVKAIRIELGIINERLSHLGTPASGSVGAVTRIEAGDSTGLAGKELNGHAIGAETIALLAQLKGEVLGILQDVSSRRQATVHERYRRSSEPWWVLWNPVVSKYKPDNNQEAALSEVYLMTPPEVAERFGTPTSNRGGRWQYERDSENLASGDVQLIAVNFNGGFVESLEIYLAP